MEEVLDAERFAVSELILAAVVRIATNARIWKKPASQPRAFDFVEGLRDHAGAVRIAPGPRHWRLFRELVVTTGSRGADTTEAYLAPLAVEHGCEWWTADAGFQRFKGLRWRNVLTT